MKKHTMLWIGLCLLTGTLLSGCKNNDDTEILKPIAEHIVGKWTRTTDMELVNGEWVGEPVPEGKEEVLNLLADGTSVVVRTGVDGICAINTLKWTVDEENCTFNMGVLTVPIWRLTSDEFGFSYHQAVNDSNETVDGSYRWLYSRIDVNQPHPIERYLGKWIFSSSYKMENGQWEEITFGIPDEGWLEYRNNSTLLGYSRYGDDVTETLSYWRVNCATGEMYWHNAQNTQQFTVRNVTVEGDTMTVLYSQNYDPTTNQVVEGEFKDILVLEK